MATQVKLKEEAKKRVIAFNGSAKPLGERSADDINTLAIHARKSNSAELIPLFDTLPTLEDLMAGTTAEIAADLTSKNAISTQPK